MMQGGSRRAQPTLAPTGCPQPRLVRKVERKYCLYLKLNKWYAFRLWWTSKETIRRQLFTLAEWEADLLMHNGERFRIMKWR